MGIFLLHEGYRLCQTLTTALAGWLLPYFGQKFKLKGHLAHRLGLPGQWESGTSVLEAACAVCQGVYQPMRELASWKLGSVWHGEPSQASLLRYPMSQLLATLVPLKTFRLQAVWWKILLRVIVCPLILHIPCAASFPVVCHSFALLCYCIPGLDAPTVSNCELVVLLLSSSTYCLFLNYCFYFCAVNVNQPEKMWWLIYVDVFENNACAYFNITMR